MEQKRKKKAVVLAGGGARGAYHVGVWKALKELNYEYSIVTGTSVGAVNGACMVIGDLELCEHMWNHIDTAQILDFTPEGDIATLEGQRMAIGDFVEQALKKKSFDQAPLKQLLTETLDVERIYDSDVDFGLVTITYPKLQPKLLYKKDIPKEHFIDFLMATSACFPAMRPYQIGDETYIDGGYYDNMPVQMAVDAGAEEIVAVNLKAVGVNREVKAGSNVKITVIEPLDDLGFILLFDGDFSKVNIRRGYYDAMKTFGIYDGWLYTFEKNTFRSQEVPFRQFLDRARKTIVPEGILEKLLEESLALRIQKKMERETTSAVAEHSTLYPAAEIAGKLFAVPPLEVYSGEGFNEILKEKISGVERLSEQETGLNPIEALKKLGDDKRIAKTMMERLKPLLQGVQADISERDWLMNTMEEDSEPPTVENGMISAAAQLLLEPLIAALYCIHFGLVE